MLTTFAPVRSSRCLITADPMKPAPPVTKMVLPSKLMSICQVRLGRERVIDRNQIFAITALGVPQRQLVELLQGNVPKPQGNFFETRVPQTLALFQNLHEVAGLEKGGMGPRIEPRETAAEHFHEKVAALQIGEIDVGDLKLARGDGLIAAAISTTSL